MPKVSVLMPVYNTPEGYLRAAVESILAQTFEDFEFIIVDDGSTNNAEAVVLSYSDSRIQYVKNEKNLGVTATRNRLVGLSHGEYLALMDSDDISLSARLAKQVEFLDTHPDVGVLGTWIEFFPESRKVEALPTDSNAMKQYLLFRESAVMNSSAMMRRSLQPHYNENYTSAEDYALWLELIDRTEFANLPEVLVRYRWHGANLSHLFAAEIGRNALKARYLAQQFHFGKDASMIDKLAVQDSVSWTDFQELLSFLLLMGEWAYQYRQKYKKILFKTEGGRAYLSFLWKSEMNRMMKIHLRHKLLNTWRVCVADKIKRVFAIS